MRILIFTGKGGVGKTSMAAATACRLAGQGRRVLVMSTDPAHSLGDSLDRRLSHEPVRVAANLYAMELDAVRESRRAWGSLQSYLRELIAMKADGGLEAEEILVFPGLEELFSLLRILDFHEENAYDALIVDCAPTGETLALLRFPERLGAIAGRLLPLVRAFTKAAGPLITRATGVPKPEGEVFDEFDGLTKRLTRLQTLLRDRDATSLRIVTTPETLVLEEARRNYTWLHLYDFGVDAVYVNRIYPTEAIEGYFEGWARMQEKNLNTIRESFRGLALFTLELQPCELCGIPSLSDAAEKIYGDADPLAVFCRERIFRTGREDGHDAVIIRLPFLEEEDILLERREDEVLLSVRNETRRFLLPRPLRGRRICRTVYREGEYRILFE